MTAICPYEALEVMETANRVDGRVWFVRDEETSFLWHRVEYVGRRLMCWCDDGFAHSESPDTERPCAHLTAVVDLRVATQQSSRPAAPIAISALVD